jgi:hypothetical protein
MKRDRQQIGYDGKLSARSMGEARDSALWLSIYGGRRRAESSAVAKLKAIIRQVN